MMSYELMTWTFSPPVATTTTSHTARLPPKKMVYNAGELLCVNITCKHSSVAQTSISSLKETTVQRLSKLQNMVYLLKEVLLEASRKQQKLR